MRASRVEAQQRWVGTLLQPVPQRRREALRAGMGHAVAFETWRSLCLVQGLSDRAAVDLMVATADFARTR